MNRRLLQSVFLQSSLAVRLVWLLFFMLIFSLLFSGLGSMLLWLLGWQLEGDIDSLMLMQAFLSFGLFLGSSIGYLTVFYGPDAVTSSKGTTSYRFFAMALLGWIFLLPFITLTAQWNQEIPIPDQFSSMADWLLAKEEEMNDLIPEYMAHTGLFPAILIIALIPALGEEFFFRGTLQRLFQDSWKNTHLSVWVTAFVFSAFHFQLFSFIPRIFLGAWMGYLMAWTGSIWVPVACHFANNLLGLLLLYFYANQYEGSVAHWTETAPPIWLAVLGLMIVGLIGKRIVAWKKVEL